MVFNALIKVCLLLTFITRGVVANEVGTSLTAQQTADSFFANQNAHGISVVLKK